MVHQMVKRGFLRPRSRSASSMTEVKRRSKTSISKRESNVSQQYTLQRFLLEQQVYEHSISDHFDISQWPTSDLIRSSLKPNDATPEERKKWVLSCCCGSGSNSIPGMLEGPSVKINADRLVIDYLSLYEGSIRASSPAIVGMDGKTTYTYEEINIASDLMAQEILTLIRKELSSKHFSNFAKNVNFEPCIGLAVNASEGCVIAILAIWKLGLPFMPIRSYQNPVKRINTKLKAARPILVIGHLDNKDLTQAAKDICPVICFHSLCNLVLGKDKSGLAGKVAMKKEERENALKIEELEVLNGGTGTRSPDQRCYTILHRFDGFGCVSLTYIRNSTIWNRVHAEWISFPYRKGEVCGLYSSIDSHEFLGQMVAPLLGGMKLVIMDVHDLYTFVERIRINKLRRLMLFSELLRALVTIMEIFHKQRKLNPYGNIPAFFDSVEYWMDTGAAMRRNLAVAFFTYAPINAKLVNLFGCREAMSFVSYEVYKSLNEVKKGNYYDVLPMGRPFINTRVYILDSDGTFINQPCVGEIYVSGLGVTKSGSHYSSFTDLEIHNHLSPSTVNNCHLSDKEANDPKSIYKYLLKTTDYGKFVYSKKTNSFPKCCTRKLTMDYSGTFGSEVVIENYRINVNEIIFHVKLFPGVKSCHVMVYRPGTVQTLLLAFVVVANANINTREELHLHLRKQIPEYMMPTISIVTGIPIKKDFRVDAAELVDRFQKEKHFTQLKKATTGEGKESKLENTFLSVGNISLSQKAEPNYVTARTMFHIFYHVCGIGEDWLTHTHLTWTLTELHIPFTTMPEIMKQLMKNGYYIEMEELFNAETAGDILALMEANKPTPLSQMKNRSMYQAEIITDSHALEVQKLYMFGNCSAEYTKSIAYFVGLSQEDVGKIIVSLWSLITSDPYSICIRNKKTRNLVAALLNADHHKKCRSKDWNETAQIFPIKYRLELVDVVDQSLNSMGMIDESKAKDALECLYLVYDPKVVDFYEDMAMIMDLLFAKLAEVGTNAGFSSTYCTVFDYIMADRIEETMGFEKIEYKQVNMFTARDQTKPFNLAPDTIVGQVLYRSLKP